MSKYVVPILIVFNFVLTVALALILNVWVDEIYSLQTTGKDLHYALHRALYFESQPPAYFVLLYLLRRLSTSIFIARLFSIFCISLSIYVAAQVSTRYLKDIHPGWIASVVAFNPLTIYAAVEIRVYALVILLSVLLLLFFYDGYLSKVPKPKSRYFYILLSILALYTQYYLGFILVANASALLVLRRWKIFWSYVIGMIIVALAFTPMLFVLVKQLTAQSNTIRSVSSNVSLLKGIRFLFYRLCEYVLPMHWQDADNSWVRWLGDYICRCAAIWLLFIFVKTRSYTRGSCTLVLSAILGTMCLFFLGIANIVSLGFLANRHTAILLIPCILLVFGVINLVKNRKVLILTGVIVLLSNIYMLFINYGALAKDGDWGRVASYIMESEKPCEPILFYINEGILTFRIYYSGSNQLLPLVGDPDASTYDLHQKVLRDEEQIYFALSRIACLQDRVWLVTWNTKPYLGIDFHPEILEDFVKNKCSVISDKTFHYSKVRLLKISESGEIGMKLAK